MRELEAIRNGERKILGSFDVSSGPRMRDTEVKTAGLEISGRCEVMGLSFC
jgi:hypothetical protein